MSDDKLPRIPSFAELGISEDEIEELERDIAEEAAAKDAEEEGGAGESASDPATVGERASPTGRPPAAGRAPAAGQAPAAGRASPGDRSKRRDDPSTAGRKPPARKPGRRKRSLFGGRKRKKAAPAAAPATVGSDPRVGRATKAGPATQAGSAPAAATPEEATLAPPPWGGMRGPVSLVLLVVAAWFSSSFRVAPAPVPASAPDSVFSSARAMTHLVRIASDAHPPGSPAHGRVREYLLEELRGLGHEPAVQTTTSFAGGGFAPTAATIRNVVARIPGSDPGGRAVLVTAHYDSREIARGAGDDGSGVVTILEALRALGERAQLRNDLIVLLTDAEELGLLGARAFVDEHPWMEDVALLFSIEMRGGGGPSMMFETGAENGWVIEAMRQADPYPAANSVSYEIYQRMPNDTDFSPFKEAGKQGLNFASLGRAHVYHQVYDTPENLDERTLQHHGEHALAMLQHFGDADLTEVDGPDVSYISIPFLGLVTYGALWIWVLGVLAVVAWVAAFLVGKWGGSRTSGVVVGLGAGVVWWVAAGVAAFYLVQWRSGAHVEAGALHAGVFHSEGWYVLAIVSFTFALVTGILALLRRWFSLGELAVGGLFVPVALAGVWTVMLPMAAMNMQWPALAACVGALAIVRLPRSGRPGFLRWLAAVVAAVPVVVVLTPLTEAVWLAMGLGLAPAVAALAAVIFILLLPLLDTMREPNGWWAPLTGLAVSGAFLAVGMWTATPSAERPAPSTLVYALDRETGSAYWGTDPTRDDSDAGVQWASAAAGPFSSPATAEPLDALGELNTRGVRFALAAAEPLDAPPPTVSIVADSTVPSGLLRVSIASAIGAEMMLLQFREDGPALAAVNGKSVPGDRRGSRIEHWGTPEGDGVFLDFAHEESAGDLRFAVVEHHLRPSELLGTDRFARPPELAPNIRMLSDRAMIRTVFSVNVGTGEVRMETASEPAGAEEDVGAEQEPVAAEADTVAAPGDSVRPDTIRPDTIPAEGHLHPTPVGRSPRRAN